MAKTPKDLGLRRLQTAVHLNSARILRAMERRITELFATEGIANVTPAQGNALVILFQMKRPLTARELAGAMSVSQVTVGRFIKALESGGWITRERDPADARAMLIRLTPKAYDQLPALIRVSNAMLDDAFADMEPRQIELLQQLTNRIRANLEDGPQR